MQGRPAQCADAAASRARRAVPARARRRRLPPRSLLLIAARSLRAVCTDGTHGCERDCTHSGGYATDCRTFKHNPCTQAQYAEWADMTKDMGFSDFRAEDVNWNKPIAWRGAGGCTLDNQDGCLLGEPAGCAAAPPLRRGTLPAPRRTPPSPPLPPSPLLTPPASPARARAPAA